MQNHVWNALKLNDGWYHLDLTWDDPITTTGQNLLEYHYFLITTNELLEKEKTQHSFDSRNLFGSKRKCLKIIRHFLFSEGDPDQTFFSLIILISSR